MESYLQLIVATATLAIACNLLLTRFGLPPLIGYITAGTVIAAAIGPMQADDHLLREIAEFGVVFLMFTIGLEFSIGHLNQMRREVLLHGALQFLATASLFSLLGFFLLGLEIRGSMVVGAALALSAPVIVLKFLNANRLLDKPYGRIALGMLLFHDLAVIPILLMIQLLTNPAKSIPALLLQTAASAVLALSILWIVGKYLLTHLLRWTSHSQENFVATILLITVSAALFTHTLGFSYSLGAFFAGLMIAETKYKYQVEADLVPFRDLLLGVFFVTVGMQIDLFFLLHNLLPILAVTLAFMAIKGILLYLYVSRVEDRAAGIRVGLALCQGGGFSFVVLEAVRGFDLLPGELNQTLTIAVVLSMIATPFILNNLNRLSALLEPEPISPSHAFKHNHLVLCGTDRCFSVTLEEGHVVVCGYGALGEKVVERLKSLDMPYIAIEHSQRRVEEGIARGDAVLFGNAAQESILRQAWVAEATAVIIAVDDIHKAHLMAEGVARVAKQPVIVARVSGNVEGHPLLDLPIKSLVHEHDEIAKLLIDHALTCEVMRPYLPRDCRACCPGQCSTDTAPKQPSP